MLKKGKKPATAQSHLNQIAEGLFLRYANIKFPFYKNPNLSDFQIALKQCLVDGADYAKTLGHVQRIFTTQKSRVYFLFFDILFLTFFETFLFYIQQTSEKYHPSMDYSKDAWHPVFGYHLFHSLESIREGFGRKKKEIEEEKLQYFEIMKFGGFFFWFSKKHDFC